MVWDPFQCAFSFCDDSLSVVTDAFVMSVYSRSRRMFMIDRHIFIDGDEPIKLIQAYVAHGKIGDLS